MNLLQLKNVALQLTANHIPVLKNINYHINKGDFVILLGSNGSGKSSLLKLLHREHRHYQGNVYFLDRPLENYNETNFAKSVVQLNQHYTEILFSDLTIYENFLLVRRPTFTLLRKQKQRTFLQSYLIDFNPALAAKLDALVSDLSGGERQALALAFCLLYPPTLLLLDEHTSALDPNTSKQLMLLTQRLLTQHQITCILTTHDLDIALNYGNRIIILKEGEIAHVFDEAEKSTLSKEMLLQCYAR